MTTFTPSDYRKRAAFLQEDGDRASAEMLTSAAADAERLESARGLLTTCAALTPRRWPQLCDEIRAWLSSGPAREG